MQAYLERRGLTTLPLTRAKQQSEVKMYIKRVLISRSKDGYNFELRDINNIFVAGMCADQIRRVA